MAVYKARGSGGPMRLGTDYEFNSSFTVRGIDLGAAVVRTDTVLLHGVPLRLGSAARGTDGLVDQLCRG